MSLICLDVGKKRVLQVFIDNEPMTMRLFKNDYTPVHDSVLANFTECDFTGYAAQALAGGAVAGALDAGGRAVASFNMLTWTKNGVTGNTVFGHYLVNAANQVVAAERLGGGHPLTIDGQILNIQPKITQKSEFSNV